MTILYEGLAGSGPSIFGLVFILLVCITASIFCAIVCSVNKLYSIMGFAITTFVCIGIFGTITMLKDDRYPIVKATINETVSWKEIDEKYELLSQEGDIYTFKVKEIPEDGTR